MVVEASCSEDVSLPVVLMYYTQCMEQWRVHWNSAGSWLNLNHIPNQHSWAGFGMIKQANIWFLDDPEEKVGITNQFK